jgi:type I restriction enzyme S subunit
MSKTNENKLVPKLRFPEFQNNEEWVTDKVDSLFRLQDGYPFSSSDFTNTQKEAKQVVRISDINNQNKNREKVYISVSRAKELGIEKCKVQKGDLLLSLTGAAGFNFFIWNADDAYINQRTIKLVPKKQENKGLIILLEPLIHSKINAIGTGQNNNLSKDALKEIEFPFPQPNEQQKIATCLSSLDEVITAESQKLDLLKEHKKGLLQNLFPQEGKTVPKLRFKEFEDGGEWEETTLTQVADYKNGKAHEQDIDDSGDFIVVNSKFISSDGEVKKSTNIAFCPAQKGDILMVLSDIPNGKAIAKCFLVEEEDRYTVNQRVCKITPRNLNSKILYYLLNRNPYFLAFDDGVKQTNLRKEDVLNCPLMMPEDHREQKKIAETLSSIDDLINAQSQKIEALKLHKKGLLQGLFPDINEENPSNSMEVENDRN